MEIEQKDEYIRTYSVPDNPNIRSYQFFESYLEKKARNIFLGFQKRFFRCLEGKIIIYFEKKESKQINGQIEINSISSLKSIDSKSFSFECDNTEYLLKAENEKLKNKWIEVIQYLMNNIKQNDKNENNLSFDGNKSIDDIHLKKIKNKNSIPSINKTTAFLIKKYGYYFNKEDVLSGRLLERKGITKLININEPKIKIRIHYGFMNMKDNINNSFNKRWIFIFSPRPLYNKYYNENIYYLEQSQQKEWLKYDTLYLFKCDNDNSRYVNQIDLVNSHNIVNFEKNNKYYINLDIGDKIYDFYCDIKSERDEWFEVIKNSQRTSKEYQLSITKHPRNVYLLNILYDKDQKEFLKKVEDEKVHTIGNCKRINEFKIFDFTMSNLQFLIESTIDGFLCSNPKNLDIIQLYTNHMIVEYLEIVKLFWNKQYNKISNDEIIKLSYIILNFGENLEKLYIEEQNLIKNGRELAKIYFNKNFQNILTIIENILKNEREKKGKKNEEGLFFTQGPNELFDILNDAFEAIKLYKHQIIYKKLLKIYYISITQYIIGVNCVITNQDLIIGHEYLISVANSSFNLIQLLNTLIDKMKKLEVLSEKEIIEEIELKKITNYINKLILNSIIRFVYEHKDELSKEFENINYLDLNLKKVVIRTSKIFNEYKLMMSIPIIKRAWNEILKLTLNYYISLLIFTGKKKEKNLNKIKAKIKNDKDLLIETYSSIVGENLIKPTIKILDDIYNFFDVSQLLIVSSSLIIRQYIGPAFSGNAAKKLVSLRTDFSKNDKEELKKKCEEAIKNYKGSKDDSSGYFNLLGEKIRKDDKEKKILQKISEENFGNNIVDVNDKNNEKLDNIKDNGLNLDDEKEQKWTIVKSSLGEFLKDFSDGDEDIDIENNRVTINNLNINENNNEYIENSNIDFEGFLHKKAFQFYKKFYFQIKNDSLYMFKTKFSNIILNKYSLKNIDKIEDYKQNKFILKILENFNENNNKKNNNNNKKYFREHKFKCVNENEKKLWIIAISKAIKKIKMDVNIQFSPKIEIKEYKIIIKDFFNLKNIKIDEPYMKIKVLSSLIEENYFQIIPSKIKSVRKSIKKIKEEEKKMVKIKKQNEIKEDNNIFGKKIKKFFKISFSNDP